MKQLIFFVFFFSLAAQAKTLNVRLSTDISGFDWTLSSLPTDTLIMNNIGEGLYEFDSNLKLQPRLARKLEVSTDKKVYTFKIRENVKWSDGKPLEAKDFYDSWMRLLEPLSISPYAYFLLNVEGAADYHAGKNNAAMNVGIRALDATTLEVRLKNPDPNFAQLLTMWVTYPIRKDLLKKYGTAWATPEHIAVVGPYLPSLRQPGKRIVLKRNENYFGSRPQFDEIAFHIIGDHEEAVNLFKAGKLDFMMPVSSKAAKTVAPQMVFQPPQYLRTNFILFNTKPYPFENPKVRQAIAMAIDRKSLIKTSLQKIIADSFVPLDLFPEGKDSALAFNPTEAKRLLKEAGFDPKTFQMKIEIVSDNAGDNLSLTHEIQTQLEDNLGVKAEIRLLEFQQFKAQVDFQNAAIYILGWGADYLDPRSFMDVFLSDSGTNRMHWKNSHYDEIVKQAAIIPSGSERTKLYKAALEILLRSDPALVPLYYLRSMYLWNPALKNLHANGLNYFYFRDVTN